MPAESMQKSSPSWKISQKKKKETYPPQKREKPMPAESMQMSSPSWNISHEYDEVEDPGKRNSDKMYIHIHIIYVYIQ